MTPACARRALDAGLLLDKPTGPSSNGALQAAKRLYRAAKAGHAGTLDPLASGLLVVLFGEATKLASLLLESEKEYLAEVRLGERTDTGDAEGEVLERSAVNVSDECIAAALQAFRGSIEQIPPMHSALKRGGVPLYRIARRGELVKRAPRRVEIRELALLARRAADLELRIRCSKGTYIRTLAENIGEALGTGAHLRALRRTASGALRIEQAVRLDELEGLTEAGRDARLMPMEALLGDLPRVELDARAEDRFRKGQAIEHAAARSGACSVFRADGGLIGLGEADGAGRLRPLRVTASAGMQAADKHQKTF
jgi:tRNA pseudouridine55 synthase